MKNVTLILILLIGLLLSSCKQAAEEISLSSMINEMTDRSWIAEYPDPFYSVKQFSSYDQNSVSPDEDGWFANHDASWFIGEENNQGRREFVMLDANGPGAIVRLWMTFGNADAYTGTIRFYFDGSETPEIEGPVLDVISGGMLVGEPLSSSVSPETNYFQRGHNLYLPIPYADHLKITYECDALNPEKHSPSVYYNINYRTWEEGTPVVSFTLDELEAVRPVIDDIQTILRDGATDESMAAAAPETHEKTGVLAAGEEMLLSLSGKAAIQRLSVMIQAENLPQALRSTVLEISFDGQTTVWSPVGEFFGTGYQVRPYTTWYTKVDDSGLMASYWLMPFKKSAEVKLVNYGDQDVEVFEFKTLSDSYKWTSSSMHFGAVWQELREVETGGSSHVNGDDGHFDVNYVTLSGKGVYMGTGLTIFNTVDAWWGEGDEKIWVDGESFPSFIGTGTEDYFGYAWCRPEKFDHFLIAQPDGAGNFHPGMSVNLRYHIFDGIPFTKSLQFDLELWHWSKTIMNYAPMSFWYIQPGGEWNIKPDPEAVKKPVSLMRSDIIEPKAVENGILEGEDLSVIRVSNGNHSVQTLRMWDWSNDAQLWWIADQDGAELDAQFLIQTAGTYEIEMVFSKAIDYGNFEVSVNGHAIGQTFSGYHDQTGKEVITQTAKLGTFNLQEGKNLLSIKIKGQHPKALPRYMVGIDQLKFNLL